VLNNSLCPLIRRKHERLGALRLGLGSDGLGQIVRRQQSPAVAGCVSDVAPVLSFEFPFEMALLVVPGAVDQVHDVVNLMIADRPEQLRLGAVPRDQVRHGPAHPLDIFEVVGSGAGAAGVLDFLLAGLESRALAPSSAARRVPPRPRLARGCRLCGR
jgi:hypothetical protein